MMPFYAPFGPFNNYNYRRANNYYPNNNYLHNSNLNSNNLKENPYFPSVLSKKEQENSNCFSDNNNFLKTDNKNDNVEDFNNGFFEIFGLKLAFDDLLIIAMLFFLYKEEVKDTYLYMALILLLLT